MTTALSHYDGEPMPEGARALGVRVKPIIRLGMGFRDESRRGAPVKTDYFTVRGDERASVKFRETYASRDKDGNLVTGDDGQPVVKPKAIEILLPTELDVALTIQYRAFKGASGEDGGTLVAVGHTNFALRDYVGGPDVLTVFDQDGTVREVETLGLDANTKQPLDDAAKELGIELYTTLRAGMPRVLGFGSYFEISTKGKQSTDNLWAKLRELYGLFGSKVSFAVQPMLTIREATARPVVRTQDGPKRIKSQIYVLDVVVPESIDAMIGRLQERNAALAPGGPVAALYGPTEVPASRGASAGQATTESRSPGGDPQAAGAEAPAEAPAAPDPEPADPDDDPEPIAGEVVDEGHDPGDPGETVVPIGQYKGRTLADLRSSGDDTTKWLLWASRNPGKFDDAFNAQLTQYLALEGLA
jgi:hypothetical protein